MADRNLFHTFARALVFILALLLPVSVSADPTQTGKKHSVEQLVEWELTANNAMSRDALNRMAFAVLEGAEPGQIPGFADFKTLYVHQKTEAVALLPLSELKKIVLVPVKLQYLEIPKDEIAALGNYSSHELQSEISERVKEAIFFEKNGKPYVRWFLHPLAGERESEMAKAIKERFNYTPLPVRGEYKFNFTSSRSMIVFKNGFEDAISLKVSLPAAEGPFKNKQIHLKEYTAWTRHNEYLADLLPENSTENLILLNEPIGLGAGRYGKEDAFLTRDLRDLPKGKRYYLPAFSVLESETGAKIAALNGSNDPLKYWEKNFLEPMAKGLAEIRAKTGAEHTSAHSQNLMVELDENMKPTGKIVLRDFDFYIDETAFDVFNRVVKNKEGLIDRRWTPDIAPMQRHSFTLRNGLPNLPSWMTEKDYGGWVKKYFSVFGDRYSEVTGIPKSLLNLNIMKYTFGGYVFVENDDFAKGKDNNFHSVDLKGKIGFSDGYRRWLTNRREEIKRRPAISAIAEVIPQAAVANQKNLQLAAGIPITNWDEAMSEIHNARVNLSGFEEASDALKRESAKFDLKTRKGLANQINSSKIKERIVSDGNPKAALALIEAVGDLEPLLITPLYSTPEEIESVLKAMGATPDQILKGKTLISSAQDHSKALNRIKFEDIEAALRAAKSFESKGGVLRQSVADAFAYRINRTKELGSLYDLTMSLAKIGAGDNTVTSFLSPKLTLLPEEYRSKVAAALTPTPFRCDAGYSAIAH